MSKIDELLDEMKYCAGYTHNEEGKQHMFKIMELAQDVKNEYGPGITGTVLKQQDELVQSCIQAAKIAYNIDKNSELIGFVSELGTLVHSIKSDKLSNLTTHQIVARYMSYYMEARGFTRRTI